MASLIHHIHPYMHKSISEVEKRINNQVAKLANHHIQAVHKHLDAFELCELARQPSAIDFTTI